VLALGALAVLGAAVEWVVRRSSMEGRRAEVERLLSAALGREVRFAGEFHLELLPKPRLEATQVTVANGPGRPSPHLLAIDTLRLEVALWPLLERRFEIEGLAIDGADLRLEPGADGSLDALPPLGPLAGEGAAPVSGLSLHLDRLELRDVRVAKTDPAGGVTALQLDALEIATGPGDQPIEWSARGTLQGGGFDLAGSGGPLRALLHPGGPWPLSLAGRIGEAEVQVSGRIAEPLRLAGLDLDVEIELPELGRLLGHSEAAAGLGGARMRAHLVDPGGERRLEGIALEPADDAELRLRVTGSVQRLEGPSGIELDVEIETDRLRRLESVAGRTLPEGSLRAKLRLRDQDGTLGVEGDAQLRARDGSLSLDLEGALGDLVGREALDAKLRLGARDLAALGRAAAIATPLPGVGPVVASARLHGSVAAPGVEGLRFEAGRRGASWILVEGSVGGIEPLAGVRLDARFGARNLAELGRELRLARALPDVGPIEGRAGLRDPRAILGLERVELRGGTPGLLDFELRGSLADLRQIDALEAQAKLSARDLGLVGALFGATLPVLGPFGFEGRVRGSDERFDSEGSVRLGESRLEGRASAELAGRSRPRVEADLRATLLRLEDLGFGRPEAGAERRPFSWADREPLPFERLRLADARIAVRAQRVTAGGGVEVHDAQARFELEDGDLRVRDLRLAYQGGQVAGALQVDTRAAEPALRLRLDASALDLERLAEALGSSQAETGSGQLDLALDLSSRGASPASLRQRLGGRLALALRDWSAAGAWSRRFLMDLSRAFLGAADQKPDRVGCLVGTLAFASGVGTVEQLVLTGSNATITGRGRIDLARERFDLELVPTVHKPGLLSLAAAVRVTGPLQAPSFQPVPLDVVSSALGSIARTALRPAKLATGGAQRVLGPAGGILAPVQGAIGFASGERARPAQSSCALPPPAAR
jgi:uncharacterized protein involved in outer membrane biogenesis